MNDRPIIVWFRQDLRMTGHAALEAAAADGAPVIPVYVLDDDAPAAWRAGGASRWWLHGSIAALSADLAERGAPLVLRAGRAVRQLFDLASATNARAIFWTQHVEPFWHQAEVDLAHQAARRGIETRSFPGTTVFPPGAVVGHDGRPLKVFTAFWRTCLRAAEPAKPGVAPSALRPYAGGVAGDTLASCNLRPSRPDWAGGLRANWQPGERAARKALSQFLEQGLHGYQAARDLPESTQTSRLSPRLHFGELSPAQVWHAVKNAMRGQTIRDSDGEAFLRQLVWREFYYHTLARHPDLTDVPLQHRFLSFPWCCDPERLRSWQQGRTGYPIVDAGMRQLWQTGWLPNRVRMIVASFLVKDLLIPWQDGEKWFWDTLVDADLANNAGGWQWVAGTGTDAAPYFRIFNPVSQGEKFDSEGAYVRCWLPELRSLPTRYIHRPWEASPLELASAGIRLGETYPWPIVDHAAARRRALAAFESVKAGASHTP